MVYNSLSEIFDSIAATRARLRARLSDVASEKERLRPAPEAWSVAEIVEHLAIIEERLSKLFPVILTKAEAANLKRSADQPFQPVSVESMVERSRREKYSAPENAQPTGKASVADSVARLDRSREEITSLRPRLETLDLTSLTFPHPVFGPFNAYQWLIFLGMHENRHLRQIESVMASHELKREGA